MKAALRKALPFVLLAILCVGIFLPLPAQESGRIRDYARDLGHFPACVIAFWALYQVAWPRVRPMRRACLVFLAVTVVQTLFECLQPLVGRSGSLRDWLLGLAGTLFALAFCLLLHVRKPHHKSLLVLKMVALVALSVLPLVLLVREHQRHVRAFPLLGSFESRMEIGRWDLYGLDGHPSDQYVSHGNKAGCFVVNPEFSFPGLFMEGLVTDWTGYQAVTCDLYLEGERSRTLCLRVDDHQETLPYADRGQVGVPVQPGFNTVAIPVADLMKTPGGRTLDRTHITRYGLFFEEKVVGDVFYLDDFRLEK